MSANIRLVLLIAAIGGGCLGIWKIVDLVAAGRVSKAAETYNQENRDAADAATEARARVRACYAGGGLWNREAGECRRPVPQPR